jgi:hypothetical protein
MPQVVIDGVACSVTFEQLKQFDSEAALAGVSREMAARPHLAELVAAGKRKEIWGRQVRRNASDTQANKEHLAQMCELAEALRELFRVFRVETRLPGQYRNSPDVDLDVAFNI